MSTLMGDFLAVVLRMQTEEGERMDALGKLFSELQMVREELKRHDDDSHHEAAARIEEAVAQTRLALFGDDGRPSPDTDN